MRKRVKKSSRRTRSKPRGRPRRVWKRETWKPYKVIVSRDRRGRFVKWARIRPKPRARRVSKKENVAQRWAKEQLAQPQPRGRSLGVYGRASVKRGRSKIVQSRRWELYKGSASGREWQNAVGIARRHPPKQPLKRIYVDDLDPSEYEGEWVDDPKIESG